MRFVVAALLAGLLFAVADRTATSAQEDLVAEGRQLYDRSCVGCHGTNRPRNNFSLNTM